MIGTRISFLLLALTLLLTSCSSLHPRPKLPASTMIPIYQEFNALKPAERKLFVNIVDLMPSMGSIGSLQWDLPPDIGANRFMRTLSTIGWSRPNPKGGPGSWFLTRQGLNYLTGFVIDADRHARGKKS